MTFENRNNFSKGAPRNENKTRRHCAERDIKRKIGGKLGFRRICFFLFTIKKLVYMKHEGDFI